MGSLKKYILLSILVITTTLFGAVLWFSITQLSDVVQKNRLEERVSYVIEHKTDLERLLKESISPALTLKNGIIESAVSLGSPQNNSDLEKWVQHLDTLMVQKYNLHSDHTELHLIFYDELGNPLPIGVHYLDADFDGYWDPGHVDQDALTEDDLKKLNIILKNRSGDGWINSGLSTHSFINSAYLWSYGLVSNVSLKPFAVIVLSGTSDVFNNSLQNSSFDLAPSMALLDLDSTSVIESPDYNPDLLSKVLQWRNTTYQDQGTQNTYQIYENSSSNLKVLSQPLFNGWTLIYQLPSSLLNSDVNDRIFYSILATIGYIFITLILGSQLAKYYDEPLQDLVRLLDTSATSVDHFPLAPSQHLNKNDEIGLLLRTFNELSQSLNQSQEEMYSLQVSLEHEIEEKGKALQHTHQLLSQSVEKLANQNTQLESVHQLLSSNAKVIHESRAAMTRLEKMASLKFLVSGVAHELNTPIGNAITLSTFVEQELNHILDDLKHTKNFRKERLVESVRTLRDSISQLENNIFQSQEIIIQIERLGRLDHSDQTRCFAIAPFLEEIIATMALDAPMPLEVIVENHYLFEEVNTDPAKLMQLIKPLVQNSIDHGFVHKDRGTIHITLTQDPEGLLLEYKDDGIGLSEEILNHMLTPFYSSAFGSHKGLGLNYVYNLCTQYFQGNFEAFTSPGGGFTAHCLLRGIARCD